MTRRPKSSDSQLLSDGRLVLGDGSSGTEWSIFVAGDCVISGSAGHSRPIGDGVRDLSTSADLSVVNLEAPTIETGTPIQKSGPHKQSSTRTPQWLRSSGFDAVTLANNHTMDYGESGLRETIESCNDEGLGTVGAGDSAESAIEPLSTTIADREVSVFNLCEREFGVAGDDRPGTAWINHPEIDQRIETVEARSDVVVVIAHAGIEFVPFPPPHLQERFRRFIDAGADVVIGHHPHVPQGWERYGDGLICYSVGNFLFDMGSREKPDWGMTLKLSFSNSSLRSVDIGLTEVVNGEVIMMDESRCRERLEYLGRLSTLTESRDALAAHWQEQAVRIFHQRYTDWLTTGVGANALQLARHPSRILELDDRWDSESGVSDSLILLNLVRNESHSAVIQTALETITGVEPDRRTPDVRDTVRELLEWTEDRPVYDPPPRLRRSIAALADRYTPE